ncbi:hypothetical protein [Acetobacter conturbans]|uniref:hypothetical protein n=1 Tax=Acetobacter conturbans TaxID=1737472 RepID=UPI001F54FC55|nr:hypothetical protein [Acetobacter conturbans]
MRPFFLSALIKQSLLDWLRPGSVHQRAGLAVAALGVGMISGSCSDAAYATTTTQHHRTTSHRHAGTGKSSASSAAKPVILSQQPGTELDKDARTLAADDIATSRRHHEEPVVLIGSAPLSTKKGDVALFIELQSAALCGSAGCSTDVYLRQHKEWIKILDSVSGEIAILPTSHHGMYDLVVDGSDRWVWDGSSYQDTIGAAPIGNLRGEIEQFQKQKASKASTSGH